MRGQRELVAHSAPVEQPSCPLPTRSTLPGSQECSLGLGTVRNPSASAAAAAAAGGTAGTAEEEQRPGRQSLAVAGLPDETAGCTAAVPLP